MLCIRALGCAVVAVALVGALSGCGGCEPPAPPPQCTGAACPPTRGDGTCTPPENASTTSEDCAAVAGDGFCTHAETAVTTPEDCPVTAGDGVCTPPENALTVPADCPAVAGDGLCSHDESAVDTPQDCPSVAGDGVCTHDETAGSTPQDCAVVAGDGLCTHSENASTTPEDCPAVAGDGFCTHSENASTTPQDCPADGPPPDPSTLAPPLPEGVVPPFVDEIRFLYEGGVIQTGVAAGTIDAQRVSVARGRVLDAAGEPLAMVRVTVLDHPELGQTLTRVDGAYDLAVNGGGSLVLRFVADGFLEVQRQLQTDWNAWAVLDDVVLTALDTAVTPITAGAADVQVAQASPVTDEDGTRQLNLVFLPGTTAQKVLRDGTTVALPLLNVRGTEFTVGARGLQAMPGELPPSTAYTYAVELSVDEAADAVAVQFNQPVVALLDNFLAFPVGLAVPSGSYNRQTGAWEAEPDGRVVAVLGVTGGLADIDSDGDAVADDADARAALGITDDERSALAALYPSGGTVWRVRLSHFSPHDWNWNRGFPPEWCPAGMWPCPPDPLRKRRGRRWTKHTPCDDKGSILECENMSMREVVPVAGTADFLTYASRRAPDNVDDDTLVLELTGDAVPAPLARIEVRGVVAGRAFGATLAPAPHLTWTLTWDRLDAYGRPCNRPMDVVGEVRWIYPAVYNGISGSAAESSFGAQDTAEGGPIDNDNDRINNTVTIIRRFAEVVGEDNIDTRAIGLGGWTLSSQHVLDVRNGVVYRGDGTIGRFDAPALTPLAGNGAAGSGLSGSALETGIDANAVAVAPDGVLWTIDNPQVVRRVGTDGTITTATCTTDCVPPAEGLLLEEVQLYPTSGFGILDVDGAGRLLVVERRDLDVLNAPVRGDRLWRVGSDGRLELFAGSGAPMVAPGPASRTRARDAALNIGDVTAAPDGSVILTAWASLGNGTTYERVYRIIADGTLLAVAGNGTTCTSSLWEGDGMRAAQVPLCGQPGAQSHLRAVANAQGDVYVTSSLLGMVLHVLPDGTVERFAGVGGFCGPLVPGASRLDACFDDNGSFRTFGGVRLGADGVPIVSAAVQLQDARSGSAAPGVLVRLATHAQVLAGGGNQSKRGTPALQFDLHQNAWPFDVGPNATLVIADGYPFATNRRLWRVASDLPEIVGSLIVPDPDGRAGWVFDAEGRHLQTRDLLTGAIRRAFSYDDAGRLTDVTDDAGNVTHIEHAGDGTPLGIVAPGGQRTELSVNASGWLSAVANPLGDAITMTYADAGDGFSAASGLLETFTLPSGSGNVFGYDPLGRLISDENALGGTTTLGRTELPTGHEVTLTSPEGAVTRRRVEEDDSGVLVRSTITHSGVVTRALRGPDASMRVEYADGTAIVQRLGPDPRFGMNLPLVIESTVQKAGHTVTTTATRTATAGNGFLGIGALTETATVAGATTSLVTDAVAHTVTLRAATGREVVIALDAQGRRTQTRFGGAFAPVELAWSTDGLLAEFTRGIQAWTYGYDAGFHIASATDATGRAFAFDVDDADRLTGITYPGGMQAAFRWSTSGDLRSFTLPGSPSAAVHTLDTNGLGQATAYTPPNNSAGFIKTYRSDGSLAQLTLPSGRTEVLATDASNRLASNTYDAATVDITYVPGLDLPSTMERTPSGQGTPSALTFGYDAGLVTSVAASGASSATYSYTWGDKLQPASVTLTSGADAFTYAITRNADRRATGYGPLTYTRDPATGVVTAVDDGNTTVDVAFTPEGKLAGRTLSVGGIVRYSYAIAWDASGLATQATLTTSGPGATSSTWDYTHDTRGRITDVARDASAAEHYTYDARGNRNGARHNPGALQAAAFDLADRIQSRAGISYTVDVDGFVTARGGDTFTTSAAGELLLATVGGTTVTYDYDALRRRVRRTDGGNVSTYFYGELKDPLRVTAYRGPSGALTSVLYDALGMIVAFERDSARFFVGTDAVGSVRAIVDDTGAIVRAIDYDAYGIVQSDTAPGFDFPFGYAGGIADPVTELVHFGLRDYEPASGRFTAPDPIFLGGKQLNVYAYVGSSPVGLRDPWGTFCVGGSGYEGVGGGGKLCFGGDGWSACGEIGFGIGGGVDVAPFADPDKTFMGFEAEAKIGAGPVGLGGNASWGNYGDPRDGLDGFCFRGDGSIKASLGLGEVDLIDPSNSKVDPTKNEEMQGHLDDLAEGKTKIGAEAKGVFKYCQEYSY